VLVCWWCNDQCTMVKLAVDMAGREQTKETHEGRGGIYVVVV